MLTHPMPEIKRLALMSMVCVTMWVTGCIEVPELDAAGDPALANAPYPDLVNLDPIVAASVDPAQESTDLQADLVSRAAALERRARVLRGDPVLDPVARRRLQRGID